MNKECIRCGSIFNSNPIIQGDDVCSTCERMNSIAFWLPVLQNHNFPIPKTIIVNADIELNHILEGKLLKGSERFFNELEKAVDIVGLPAFLKTEMLSNKHDWKDSCFIKSKSTLPSHIRNLIEMSYMATIDRRTDYNFFAVRQFIETEKVFNYFPGDMPITKEVRIFVRNNKIECKHPYWPVKIFEKIESDLIKKIRILNKKDDGITNKMGNYIARIFSGYWSIDLLKAKNGEWYCIDMAIGEKSWHDADCKFSKTDKSCIRRPEK